MTYEERREYIASQLVSSYHPDQKMLAVIAEILNELTAPGPDAIRSDEVTPTPLENWLGQRS